jgi:hypothetical protein
MPGAGDTLTVTVIRRAARDQWGNVTLGAQHDIEGCLFAPGTSREAAFQSQAVDTGGTVYAPPDADVLPTDLIVVRGKTYAVVGDPQNWGTAAGIVVEVRAHTG